MDQLGQRTRDSLHNLLYIGGKYFLERLGGTYTLLCFNTVVRRSAYEAVGGLEPYRSAEDMHLGWKLAIKYPRGVKYISGQGVTTSERKAVNPTTGRLDIGRAWKYITSRDTLAEVKKAADDIKRNWLDRIQTTD